MVEMTVYVIDREKDVWKRSRAYKGLVRLDTVLKRLGQKIKQTNRRYACQFFCQSYAIGERDNDGLMELGQESSALKTKNSLIDVPDKLGLLTNKNWMVCSIDFRCLVTYTIR